MDPLDTTLSVKQANMIVHASGLSTAKDIYRDHYCDDATNPDLLKLVELGLMEGPFFSKVYGDNGFFHLTASGKDAARRFSGKLKAKDTSL